MRVGIIGGGPGGAVTGATLAKLGHEVTIFEREVFPRFHIGESLLPGNMPILEDLGITREVFHAHAYMPKTAAHFEHAPSGRTVRFPFSQALTGDPPSIFQVERSRFDHLLLKTAVGFGAVLRAPITVSRVDLAGRTIHHNEGQDRFDFIVDASGRDTLLGRQLGIVDTEGDLKRAAVFGHCGALPLAPGAERGDITICKGDAGWCWQIPLEDGKWSAGLVLKREFITAGGTPQDVFRRHLPLFPSSCARMGGQPPVVVHAIPNISYRVRERTGPGYALLGDAGGFIDPIFSSGVLLATRAGWRLGRTLAEHGPQADLTSWKAATDHDLAVFFAFIRLWYDGHFIDNLFFAEHPEPSIVRGIISLLSGNTTHPDNRFLAICSEEPHAPAGRRDLEGGRRLGTCSRRLPDRQERRRSRYCEVIERSHTQAAWLDHSKARAPLKQAALELFVEQGVQATGIRDIAKHAGCSEAALYRHWENKEDMVSSLFTEHLTEVRRILEEAIAAQSTLEDKVLAASTACYRLYDEEPLVFRFVLLVQHELSRSMPSRPAHALRTWSPTWCAMRCAAARPAAIPPCSRRW